MLSFKNKNYALKDGTGEHQILMVSNILHNFSTVLILQHSTFNNKQWTDS